MTSADARDVSASEIAPASVASSAPGSETPSAAATPAQKTHGSASPSVIYSQATRPRRVFRVHSASSVVLPKPAGAATTHSIPVHSSRRRSRRGRDRRSAGSRGGPRRERGPALASEAPTLIDQHSPHAPGAATAPLPAHA